MLGCSHSAWSAQIQAFSCRLIDMRGLRDARRKETPGWLRASRSLGHRSVRRVTRQRSDGGVREPPTPPACPPGWRTGPPDFVGIGGQRCGTTRWFNLIGSHPQVVRPKTTKELHYFDRFYAGGFKAAHAASYRDYFPRDGERKTGEWTPMYLCAPWIPRLLAEAAPQARLLVLLRDPVERYLSGLQHDAKVAREHGAPLSELAPLQALARGFYNAQLTHVLAHFDRSQILVLQYERCTREPLTELRRTFEFLGVEEPGFVPELDAHPHRQPNKPTLDADTRGAYVRAYRGDVAALARGFPEIDLALWPNFAHLADRAGS
jgi:hypothetical protein